MSGLEFYRPNIHLAQDIHTQGSFFTLDGSHQIADVRDTNVLPSLDLHYHALGLAGNVVDEVNHVVDILVCAFLALLARAGDSIIANCNC